MGDDYNKLEMCSRQMAAIQHLAKHAKLAKLLIRDEAKARLLLDAFAEAEKQGITEFPIYLRKLKGKADIMTM